MSNSCLKLGGDTHSSLCMDRSPPRTALIIIDVAGPIITMNPVDVTVTAGDTLELSCTAVNQPDSPLSLTFDWFHDDSIIVNPVTDSATTAVNTVKNQLIIADIETAGTGDYHCLVYTRSSEDGVESAMARVTVICKCKGGRRGKGRSQCLCSSLCRPIPTATRDVLHHYNVCRA